MSLRRAEARGNGRSPAPILGAMPLKARPAPPQIRLAGALVTAEGLAALVFAVVLCVQAGAAELPMSFVLGQAVFFALIGVALAAVGGALWLGRRGARTPAIVVQLLLLPVVYSLIGPSHQLVLGIVTGVVVAGTFLLLISEASRVWSMDLPQEPNQPPGRERDR
jgi:hypothetical protein